MNKGKISNKENQDKGKLRKAITTKPAEKKKIESGKNALLLSLENSNEFIDFNANSGATDHVVNNSMILSNFKTCENGIIKCGNKNKLADIVIDDRGDLILQTDVTKEKVVKLTDVIATEDVSENLLSLRRLTDEKFSIYLDDKLFRVYSKVTNKTILKGTYEKPNWVISFKVKKSNNNNDKNVECTLYSVEQE